MDIQQAYRNVPVYTSRMKSEGNFCVDAALPFGLQSAPLLFTALADAVQWVVQQGWILHYIDDFITIGPPVSVEHDNHGESMPEPGFTNWKEENWGLSNMHYLLGNWTGYSCHGDAFAYWKVEPAETISKEVQRLKKGH